MTAQPVLAQAPSTPSQPRFEEMTQPHLARLHAVARRILGSDDLAWDAVQEGLCALWRESIVPDDPRGWLVRTVVHRSLHASRTLERRRRYEDRARERRRTCSGREMDPHEALERSEIVARVAEALDRISPEFREVFELREFHALDYDAISERTGVPVGTVRSRLNRARAAVRRLLEEKAAGSLD